MTRTSAYRFTVTSLNDTRLVNLRNEVATRNKLVPWGAPHTPSWKDFPIQSRQVEEVKVQARLGKNNPLREKYRRRSGRLDTQVVHLEDGAYFDVYVHQRYREKNAPGTAKLLSAVPVKAAPKVKSATETLFEHLEFHLNEAMITLNALRNTIEG